MQGRYKKLLILWDIRQVVRRQEIPLVHRSISTFEQIVDEEWRSVPAAHISTFWKTMRTLGPPKLVNPERTVSLVQQNRMDGHTQVPTVFDDGA
jgi:hypothetical protein